MSDSVIINNPFMKLNNIEIVEGTLDYAVLKHTINENSKNPFGFVHGGLLASMCDVASGVNARADGGSYVTQSCHINYVSNVSEGDIFARSETVKRGKHISVFRVTVCDESGKLLCYSTYDMYKLG